MLPGISFPSNVRVSSVTFKIRKRPYALGSNFFIFIGTGVDGQSDAWRTVHVYQASNRKLRERPKGLVRVFLLTLILR